MLVVEVRPEFDYTQVFVTNATTTFLFNMKAVKEFEYV